jgi:integrase
LELPAIDEQKFLLKLSRELGQNSKKPIPDGMTWDQLKTAYLQYPPNSQARFAFAYLYLTGQRVSEALETRKSHIQVKEKYGLEYLSVDSITLKTKAIPRREIAIPMNRKDSPLVDVVVKHIEEFSSDAKVLPVTRMTLWNWLSTVSVPNVRAMDVKQRHFVEVSVRVHPHYLRHTRARILAQDFDFNHLHLMKFFGWTSPSMPNWYIQGGLDLLVSNMKAEAPDSQLSNTQTPTQIGAQKSQDSDDIDCITPVESHNSADSEVIDDEPI